MSRYVNETSASGRFLGLVSDSRHGRTLAFESEKTGVRYVAGWGDVWCTTDLMGRQTITNTCAGLIRLPAEVSITPTPFPPPNCLAFMIETQLTPAARAWLATIPDSA